MIEAEEYGITSSNADSMKTSDNPAVKRLVGAEGELGAAFGLDNEWSLRIIKQVGNYGESYKRNIADTGILPDRGPNELWTKVNSLRSTCKIIVDYNKFKGLDYLALFLIFNIFPHEA